MFLDEARVGMSVETYCGRFGYIKSISGLRAIVRCGADEVDNAIDSLAWVPSRPKLDSHRDAINASWSKQERYHRRVQKVRRYEFPAVAM